jgi:hypothetical protein
MPGVNGSTAELADFLTMRSIFHIFRRLFPAFLWPDKNKLQAIATFGRTTSPDISGPLVRWC